MKDFLRGEIRQNIKAIRENLSPAKVKERSFYVTKQLRQFDLYRYAKHIALYVSNRGEVLLDEIWNTAPLQGKYCYFPVLDGQRLIFLPATPQTTFKPNQYGIPEPQVDRAQAISLDDLDLVMVPLVAFDTYGNRIGMGKGYYDKTFADIKREHRHDLHLLGVAYEFQRYEVLPYEYWDVPLDGVVTEKKVYWSRIR